MNIDLSIFISKQDKLFFIGGHYTSPLDGSHYFMSEIGDSESDAIVRLLKKVDSDRDELGMVKIITLTTNMLNFLHKNKEDKTGPINDKIKDVLLDIKERKSTKFSKNKTPSMEDVLSLRYADMMVIQLINKNIIDGSKSLSYTDTHNLTEMKRAHKAIANPLLGGKLFTWGKTEYVTVNNDTLVKYYSGGITVNSASGKVDKSIPPVQRKLNQNLYTYYSGSNSRLTDAGQRSLDEIRSISFVYNKHPVIEAYLELQHEAISDLPVVPVVVGNLDKIVSGASSKRLMSSENHWFKYRNDSRDIIFVGVTRSDVSHVFYPQLLGPRIRTEFLDLERKFLNHLNGDLISEEHDITDMLYTTEVNAKGVSVCTPKTVLNGKFNFVRLNGMVFDGNKFSIKYVFGIDSPKVDVLKRLAKSKPKVSLVFENRSDTTITYYTIVRTSLGVSIYTCPEGCVLIKRRRK